MHDFFQLSEVKMNYLSSDDSRFSFREAFEIFTELNNKLSKIGGFQSYRNLHLIIIHLQEFTSHADIRILDTREANLLLQKTDTIGLLNLDHPYILSLIVDQNMLIKKWHTFVHLWEFVTLQEQLTLLGQMALSKYKIETFVHIYECFYMIHLKIGHSKSLCSLMHIIHNHFQNSVSLLMKLFFTPEPESPSRSI